MSWLPNFHDYGLVQALLEPLYSATPSYLMSPFAFVKRPAAWLRAITRYRATHSQAPNFAYDLCARRISPEQCEGLDLSSWRAAGNAAELINPKVLDAFTARFGPYGFRRSAFCPGYGLAEAILILSSSPEDEDPVVVQLEAEALEEHRIVEAGQGPDRTEPWSAAAGSSPRRGWSSSIPDTRQRCAADEVGEIWVDDPAVTEGYWGRPEETQRTFRATIADTGEGPFLRTGDLGFLRDGQIFVVGRIKDLIIIRGTNHHPQDIEWTVQAAHPALRPENGAAFSVLFDGEEKLVIAQEVELEHAAVLRADEIARVVRGAVAESHDLNVFAVLLLEKGQPAQDGQREAPAPGLPPLLHARRPAGPGLVGRADAAIPPSCRPGCRAAVLAAAARQMDVRSPAFESVARRSDRAGESSLASPPTTRGGAAR